MTEDRPKHGKLNWREVAIAIWIVLVYAFHLRLMLEFLRMVSSG